jgi:hypothetical protein
MPSFLLHAGATVLCAHGGEAVPTVSNSRVLVSAQPVATQPNPYTIASCPFGPPAGNGPCVTAEWMVGAERVLAGGQPVLLQSSVAACVPTGSPLNIVHTQTRVRGS